MYVAIANKGEPMVHRPKWRLVCGGVISGFLLSIWIAAPIGLAAVFDSTYSRDFPVNAPGAIAITFLVCIAAGGAAGLLANVLVSRLRRALFGGVIGVLYGGFLMCCVVPSDTLRRTDYWPLTLLFGVIGLVVGGRFRPPTIRSSHLENS